jgi:hypothetical protein
MMMPDKALQLFGHEFPLVSMSANPRRQLSGLLWKEVHDVTK